MPAWCSEFKVSSRRDVTHPPYGISSDPPVLLFHPAIPASNSLEYRTNRNEMAHCERSRAAGEPVSMKNTILQGTTKATQVYPLLLADIQYTQSK
jgi:hypothetical protein